MTLLLIIAVIIAGIFLWFKYFSEPLTEVVTGGAEQSLPALDKAREIGEAASEAVKATDAATRELHKDD